MMTVYHLYLKSHVGYACGERCCFSVNPFRNLNRALGLSAGIGPKWNNGEHSVN